MDSGDDDSRGDAGMDDDDALQAEVTATQTREKLNDALIKFWRGQLRDVSTMNPTLTELKNHPLPLARIKKIMKSDEDVRMISSEAPVLFAKACELFILELTHRAWAFSEANKRRTLQHNDVTAAILNHEHEVFEFLTDIFANEDGTIPEADAAAASLLAAHNPATLPQPSTSASGGSQAGGAVAQGNSAQGPQQGQAMGAHPPRTDAGAGPSNAQYGAPYGGQYAAWPGMQQGMPPPQQQQQQHMMGNMDPKMQEHLNQQMQLAQEQYMQRHAQQQGHMQPGSRQPPS